MRSFLLGLLALVALLLAGCGGGMREARAVQPLPAQTPERSAASVRLSIYQRDMHLPRDYQLRTSAEFVAVSRDRLRFHVGITRWDEAEAETASWTVWLEDDAGNRYAPEEREVARVNRIEMHWALYPYRPGDPWCSDKPCRSRILPGYEVYQGEADYVFTAPGLMNAQRKGFRLVLRKGDTDLYFSWRFGAGTEVHDYGRSRADESVGTIIVPGPDTELAGTRYEGEHWK